MLNTMKLALVLALLMLSLGQTLSNLQPVAHQSEYTKDIIALPLKRGLENVYGLDLDKFDITASKLQLEVNNLVSAIFVTSPSLVTKRKYAKFTESVRKIVSGAKDLDLEFNHP